MSGFPWVLATALIVPEKEAEDPRERIQLGPLCVAASARKAGYTPQLINLNAISCKHQSETILLDQTSFVEEASEFLLQTGPRLIGLATICSSFRITLRIVQAIRRHAPEVFLVLGGPQATAVAEAVLDHVPELNAVLRGEADYSIVALLRAVERGAGLEMVDGLSWRNSDGTVIRNQASTTIETLDDLPMPAYDLYPESSYSGGVAIDAGRGCPFCCSFCSTNEFFSRRFRMKSGQRLAEEVNKLHDTYGVREFSLTHDLFTTNHKVVRSICQEFSKYVSFDGFEWTASARIDSMKNGLAKVMARAGCKNLFFGIESGSATMQKKIGKRLSVNRVIPVLKECTAEGIECTASLIVGYPDETTDDLAETVKLAVESARIENVKIQMHLLVPLPGTPLAINNFDRLKYSDLTSNIATVGGSEPTDEEREFLLSNRSIFVQHFYLPNQKFDRTTLYHIAQFVFFGLAFHRTTCLTLASLCDGFFQVAERWASWIEKHEAVREYLWEAFYRSESFVSRLKEYTFLVAEDYGYCGRSVLETAIRFDDEISAHISGRYFKKRRQLPDFDLGSRYDLGPGVSLSTFGYDLDALLTALRYGYSLPEAEPGAQSYLFVESGRGRIEFTPLDTDLACVVLNVCDGKTLQDSLNSVGDTQKMNRVQVLSKLAVMIREGILERQLAAQSVQLERDRTFS